MKPHFFDIFTRPFPKEKILPIFIPFSGCKVRCVFCAQEIQTGQAQRPLRQVLDETHAALHKMDPASPMELAFYGGTFTALEEQDFQACLNFASIWQQKKIINKVRCSTRPDCLDQSKILSLKHAGFTTIELGIQSFSTKALYASKRNYTDQVAREACALIKETGFDLGVQLLPGMPGVNLHTALMDVAQALDLDCSFLRLYPCLVFKNTPLENDWRSGQYTPWDLDTAICFLGLAQRMSWDKSIPIARMGLAQEPGLQEKILAGPVHPNFGNIARSLALAMRIEEEICSVSNQTPKLYALLQKKQIRQIDSCFSLKNNDDICEKRHLDIPAAWQGDFWGHGGNLRQFYNYYGITPASVKFTSETNTFCLY